MSEATVTMPPELLKPFPVIYTSSLIFYINPAQISPEGIKWFLRNGIKAWIHDTINSRDPKEMAILLRHVHDGTWLLIKETDKHEQI